MSRLASGISLAAVVAACLISFACSSGNGATAVVPDQVPAAVDLCLAPTTTCPAGLNVSLEVGQFQALNATGLNPIAQVLTETFSYQSSNPAVLTIAGNGAACAGTWDSLTAPTTCTPGPTGTAQVTATALGVSSPPVTIYVHQHITRVSISKVPNQPPTLSNLCYSKGAPSGPESALYEAFAFNGNADITASVGPFAWQTVSVTGQTTSAVTLTVPPVGTPLNQEIATANSPGITPFFATVGGFHSQPMQFETCPVQSISLAALGNPATSFVVNTGTTTTLNATVTDTLGMHLVGVPLAWTVSNPISLSASGAATSTIYGSVGTVSASSLGAGSVIASCTPPGCNGGFASSLPIYPTTTTSFTVKNTSAPASPTVYVSSTGCSVTTTALCSTTVVPITGSNGSFVAGTPVSLPFTPNSFRFDSRGGNAYLGVDSSSFGTNGLMVFSGSSVSPVTTVAGQVLAVSPNVTLANAQVASLVILSDTVDVPNQVFIYNTSSQTASSFLMDNAVAAAFSPDGLKAYIVSGTSCPGNASAGCLLVYSTVDPAQMVPLTSPATDVAFVGNGSFGYLAGGDPAGAAFLPTCSDPNPLLSLGSVPLASQFIRPLPDGQSALALAPPNVQPITATISGLPVTGVDGCPAPNGFLSITNTPGPMFNLGVGNFTPTQFMISSDGSAAYILGEIPQTAPNPPLRFPFIVVFNLATRSASNISLAGSAVPLSASLSPAGDLLFVGADDGAVHIINTATFADTAQITFPFPQTPLCFGPGTPSTAPPVTCLPDLVAVNP
jgi:hypothetical protein